MIGGRRICRWEEPSVAGWKGPGSRGLLLPLLGLIRGFSPLTVGARRVLLLVNGDKVSIKG